MKTVTIYINDIQDKIEFRIGQNSKENFDIIDNSQENDLWFHLHLQSSCHVVASIHHVYDRTQTKKIAIQGAVLCKQYSKYKTHEKVPIMYTKVKHLVKQDREGAVSVQEYKILVI